MKKKIIVCILALLFASCFISFSIASADKSADEVEPVVTAEIIEPVIIAEIEEEFTVEALDSFTDEKINEYTIDQLEMLIDSLVATQTKAHELAVAARALGWPETASAIEMAKTEWNNAQLKKEYYQDRYDELYEELDLAKWDAKMAEYPEATTIWLYMKDLGWSDYVCAGIMGNMVAECGGATLALQPTIYDSSRHFYGICQWSKTWYGDIHGADLLTQCNFLRDTIKFEIDTFGYAYKKNFNFDTFLSMTNEKDAAKAFAVTYERCAEWTYGVRQKYATMAYDYFVNN